MTMKSATLFLASLLLAVPAVAQDFGNAEEFAAGTLQNKEYSPYAGRGYPTQVFWGDTHLHTNLSVDAGMFGNRLGLEEAYRFTRGEEVVTSHGLRAQLSRPLDFVVVADHSDGYGMFAKIVEGDPELMKDETARRWNRMFNEGGQAAVDATLELIDLFSKGQMPFPINAPESIGPVWDDVLEAAEQYNEPGVFTAFIGYEWTSLAPPGNNLHRVVVYRDDASQAGQKLPMTTEASIDPEDLWDYMADYEAKTGGKVLAIPHNGNLSNGMMFDVNDMDGNPLTRAYAETRDRWEPVYEVTQIKGDGEAHPLLSPDDEFADYETWDLGNLNLSQAKTEDMLQHEYGRSALKLGLQLEDQRSARREPVPVRDDRFHRLPHVPTRGRGGQLLRQALGERAEPGAGRARVDRGAGWKSRVYGVGHGLLRVRGRVGHGQHAQIHLGRHDAPRGLRHDWLAHADPVLWRVRLHGSRRAQPFPRPGRLLEGRADGRRIVPLVLQRSPLLPRRGPEGSVWG
jgi:hypothetical protein